jgi:hypothetical protein
METTIRKGHFGWEARSYTTLSNGMHLKISTYKGSRGVSTNFQAMNITNERGYQTESFVIFQDFSKSISNPNIKRVTEKSIAEAHELALTRLNEIKEQAEAHYANEAV